MKTVLQVTCCIMVLLISFSLDLRHPAAADPLSSTLENTSQAETYGWAEPAPGAPQRVVAITPEVGYTLLQPGERSLLMGELDDPFGAALMEALGNSRRELPAGRILAPASEFLVTNSLDSGVGSLRWAIEGANSNPGPDIIYFNTHTMNGKTITPASDLPPLTDDGTVIDASWNWQGAWPGGKPGITIDGGAISAYSFGLQIFGANNVAIKGLAVENFSTCIWIGGGSFNTIGEGASSFGGGRMLIRQCDGPAVFIVASHDNRVIGSYIGVSDYGNLPVPNLGDGVTIYESQRNAIGGEGPLEGNIIGASDYGIRILGSDAISNTVVANQIGAGMLDSNIANLHDGVYVGGGATYNAIGGRLTRIPPNVIAIECTTGNEISNNGGNGVTITDAAYNGVLSNFVDDNLGYGVEITNQAWSDSVGCNTVARNHKMGVLVHQPNTRANWIFRNYIGTDEYSATGLYNGHHGIGLYDGAYNNTVSDNVIGFNGWSGVAVVGAGASRNWLFGNWIGIGKNSEPMGNSFFGVVIGDSPDNALLLNTIANNGTVGGSAGVRIGGGTAISNTLSMNSIYDNAGLGIEIVDRAQNEISPPRILSAQCPGVSGDGAPPGGNVQIFSDGADEGRNYESSVLADGAGHWVYSGEFRGPNLTATVTYPLPHGDTSAFSNPAYEAGACRLVYLPLVVR
jgi:hypothetical protein